MCVMKTVKVSSVLIKGSVSDNTDYIYCSLIYIPTFYTVVNIMGVKICI